MNAQYQMLFFFAVVGAFNVLFFSVYFALFSKHRTNANYFLSGLFLAIGIKIIPSIFLNFDVSLSEAIVILGFSANALIGPLFYLYAKSSINDKANIKNYWWLHIIPAAIIFPIIGLLYPLTFNDRNCPTILLQYLVYFQWFVYLILTAIVLEKSFVKVFQDRFKSNDEETWLVSLFIGIGIFWIGPIVTSHTTYMVGALSLSFIFYGLLFFWILKFRRTSEFFKPPVKYASKKIDVSEAEALSVKLNELFKEKELFKNPNLKIADVANEMRIHPQRLSQFLNDNMGKSFSRFINEYRIDAVKKMLMQNDRYTSETIGYECGFNSKSTFYTTFKKLTGTTPANFKAKSE